MGNSNSNIRIDIAADLNPAGFVATTAQLDRVEQSANKAATASGKLAMQYTFVKTEAEKLAESQVALSREAQRVMDRYDPLGTKLRALQSDMALLRKEAGNSVSDGAFKAFSGLEADIEKTRTLMAKAGEGMDGTGKNAVNLGLNTQYARRELMQLGKEALTGDFSQMPRTFGSLVTHSNLLTAAMSPLGLGIAGVTAAVVAGGYAWYNWGKSAEEATAKALANLDKLKKSADSAARPTSQESLFNLKSLAQSAEIEADYYANMSRKEGRSAELRRIDAESAGRARQLAEGLRRQAREEEDKIARQAEAESKRNQRGYRQSEAGKAERDYQQATESATRHLAVLKAQAEATDRLTESEKKLIEFDAEHKPSRDKRIEQQRLAARGALEEAAALDRAASIKRAASKADQEAAGIIDKARTTSAEYLNQLQFETSLLGKSATEVQKLTEQRRIELQLEKELLSIRNNSAFGSRNTNPEVDAAYQRAVAAAQASAEAAKAGAEVEIEARRRVATSWEFGAKEAIRKYDEAVKNSAAQSERLFSTAFKSAEDAITKAMMTGKLSVRDFANATIEEFYRIKVAQPMVSAGANFLGDLFGGMFGGTPAGASSSTVASFGPSAASAGTTDYLALAFGGGRASGGPVSPNTLYPVNERGPELLNYDGNDYLMMGGRGGYVKPLADASSSGTMSAAPSVTVNVFNAPAGTQVQQRPDGNGGMTLDVIIEQIEGGIARNVSRGTGALSGALTQTYGLNRAAGAY